MASMAVLFGFAGLSFVTVPRALAATVPESCYSFDSGTGTITGYNPSADPACLKDINIPSTIGGVTVTAIGSGALGGQSLTNVVLPNTLVSIGVFGLGGNSFTSIVIPDSVTTISAAAFSGDSSLTNINFGNSLQSIGSSAFSGTKLNSLILPDSLTTLDSGAFDSGNPLQSIVIGSDSYHGTPHLVLTAGIFGSFTSLTSVKIGNSVSAITSGAFSNDSALISLDLGQSVQTLSFSAFSSTALTTLNIPSSVTTLGTAFWNTNIATVIIHGNPTIDPDAFDGVTTKTGSYIRLLTSDPSNPYSYTDLSDNSNGSAYIVNPASLIVKYVDSHGNVVTPGYTKTGDSLTDYAVAANPTANFSLYYRSGRVMALNAPAVNGYPTPAAQTVTLQPGDNTVTFTYYTAAELASRAAPGVPNTGVGMASNYAVLGSIGILAAGLILAVVARRRSLAKNPS